MAMAEKEQDFRHQQRSLEQDNIMEAFRSAQRRTGLGQFMGWIILAGLLAGGIYCLATDKDLAGWTSLVGAVGTIALQLIFPRFPRKD